MVKFIAALALVLSGCAPLSQAEQSRVLFERYGPECGMPPQVLTDPKFKLPAAETTAIVKCVKDRYQANG